MKGSIIVSSENPMRLEDELALCDLIDRRRVASIRTQQNQAVRTAAMLRADCAIHLAPFHKPW